MDCEHSRLRRSLQKKKKSKGEKKKEASKGLRPGDGSKKDFFLKEMLQEIVQQLRSGKNEKKKNLNPEP